jgi:hypothetical protein
MTAFVKEKFNLFGGYLTYEGKFIARFKYAKGSAGTFQTFLIKNFTQEEYFEARKTMSPLPILQAKGYIQPHIKKWLKEAGLPVTREGYETFLQRQTSARYPK